MSSKAAVRAITKLDNRGEDMQITKKQARVFILAYQNLLPPHQLRSEDDIVDYLRRVGCIQYDPLDLVGSNPNLVLQARVGGYRPKLLEELLYTQRRLVDGWDKNAAIYPVEDWPYFSRYRERKVMRYGREITEMYDVLPQVTEELRERGPLSSLDFDSDAKIDWFWAPTSLTRAALETLYTWGDVVIHNRAGARRVYDLASRHIPAEILAAPDPNQEQHEYFQWHVKRRIGSVGLLWNRSSDAWIAIGGLKTPQRNAAIAGLLSRGELIQVEVENLGYPAYISREHLPLLEQAAEISGKPKAAFIAPLDNMLWDRKLIQALFGFNYTWEVYKPAAQREFGYYVLPVLYGDKFVARFEPRLNKKTRVLEILNWWWEPDTMVTQELKKALIQCTREFMNYLGAQGLNLNNLEAISWMGELVGRD